MKLTRREALSAAALAGLMRGAASDNSSLKLWYRKPASRWTEALPVGNGHLGAMVFGTVGRERIQLNEHSLWSGRPADEDRPQTRAALPRVRQLLFEGNYAEANKLAQAEMMAPLNPATYGSYQTLGDLVCEFEGHSGEVADYHRQLNLDLGHVEITYKLGG